MDSRITIGSLVVLAAVAIAFLAMRGDGEGGDNAPNTVVDPHLEGPDRAEAGLLGGSARTGVASAEGDISKGGPPDRTEIGLLGPEPSGEGLPAVDPDENPFAVLLESGEALSAEAVVKPKMNEMDPGSTDYDPMVEAHQLFAPFEDTLRAAEPLDPTAWKAALEQHRDRNGGVMRRAEFIRASGYPDKAGDLMIEWSRLYGIYQAQAYGRPPTPLPMPEE